MERKSRSRATTSRYLIESRAAERRLAEARIKETPIERMFLKILHRKMTTAERQILLGNRSPIPKTA